MKRLAMLLMLCFPFSAAIPLTLTVLTLAQQQDPHEGQPDTCTNAKNAPKAHKCECSNEAIEEGGEGCDVEDKKCRVYCRPTKCHCFHHACDS